MDSKTKLFFVISTIVLLLLANYANATTAGFDVRVVDADTNLPLSGVEVVGWFGNSNGWKAWTESAPTYECKRTTDKNGLCHVEGETNNGKTGVDIDKAPEGYYRFSGMSYRFVDRPSIPFMHWRPTDIVITAALCKIERPVPLFVRRTLLGNGQPISERVQGPFSYDLHRRYHLYRYAGECLSAYLVRHPDAFRRYHAEQSADDLYLPQWRRHRPQRQTMVDAYQGRYGRVYPHARI